MTHEYKKENQNMIKAVFFDIDGTLLSNTTGQIPKAQGKP